jgi:uncharacterized protein YecE (DUF72 family)
MMLKIGCCGFPRGRHEYYKHFPAVEVQQTFYQPPRMLTLERWREQAPADFEFTLKAWQVVTHPSTSPTYRRMRVPLERPEEAGFFRPTDTVFAGYAHTHEAARVLKAKVVLFQCPASFTPTPEHIGHMRAFFRRVPRDRLLFAWEPRGDWEDERVRELCAELDLVHCVDPFVRKPVTARLAYFRMHGIGGYRHRYSDGELRELLDACGAFEEAYCLFNNMGMWEDAKRLKALAEATDEGPRKKKPAKRKA